MAFELQYVCSGKITEDGIDERHKTRRVVRIYNGSRNDEETRPAPNCGECGEPMREAEFVKNEHNDWRGVISHT